MSESAPRRTANEHRKAADRLSDYLLHNKQVALSPIELLDLAAQVLGVKSTDPTTGLGLSPIDVLEAHASRLSQFYSQANGGTEEHPVYSDEEWQIDEGESEGSLVYWRWVASSIVADRAMWPWDREAEPAVLIARAAHMNIEYVSGKGWAAKGLGVPLIEHEPCPSELLGWEEAARAVLELDEVCGPLSREEIAALSTTHVIHLVATRLAPALEQLHRSSKDSTFGPESGMRAFERTNSIWVRLARTAGVEVKQSLSGMWVIAKAPTIKELCRISGCNTEASLWREVAGRLIQHVRLRMGISEDKWEQKPPSQQLELIQAFFSDSRPANPEQAFEQHILHRAKRLCQGIGWKVTRGELHIGSEVWTLNQEESYPSEATAWLSGADSIRRQATAQAGISYLQWTQLSLDDQILMAQEHLL